MSPDLHQGDLQLPDGLLQAVQPAVGPAADVLPSSLCPRGLGLLLGDPLLLALLLPLREALWGRR